MEVMMKSRLSKYKKALIRILVAGFFFVLGFLTEGILTIKFAEEISIALFLISYVIIGWDILFSAIRNIFKGQIFDENFLMAIATIGAIVLKEFPEATAVMLFYQVGELFQSYAVYRSRESITELMDLCPDTANVKTDEGYVVKDVYDIGVDDILCVKVGEKIPLDGVVIEGNSSIDTSALTGESVAQFVKEGDEVISGCVNLSGTFYMKVLKEASESTATKILELVANASSKKAKTERFITKFSKIYTPAVVLAAALLAIVPPLLFGKEFSIWIYRALTFLVISCPCALVISIPLGFFGGIGGASKKGILVKGSTYFETLSNVSTILMDKTGTLTTGKFIVSKILTNTITEKELLYYAAHTEYFSNHPIAKSIVEAYDGVINEEDVKDVEEVAGHGVIAMVDGKKVIVGNAKHMEQNNIVFEESNEPLSCFYVAIDANYVGRILVEDKIKDEAREAVLQFEKQGIKNVVMLTGDNEAIAGYVAKKVGIKTYYAKLLPQHKVELLESYLSKLNENEKLIFIGDGINDAPVLARADIGIAMGSLGSDAAIEASDVVIMADQLTKVGEVIKIAKKTMKIVKQNIVFALGIKFLILGMSVFGLSSMWLAVFADVGVSFLAILNSMRASRT